MIVILAIQCLFFADGGLMALGANIWNMAFYGCFVGYYLIWRPIMRSVRSRAGSRGRVRAGIVAASLIGRVDASAARFLGGAGDICKVLGKTLDDIFWEDNLQQIDCHSE